MTVSSTWAQEAGRTSSDQPKVRAPRGRSVTQKTRNSTNQGKSTASVDSEDRTETLLAEQRAAVAEGDPGRIKIVSEQLIASALRHYGDLRILQGDYGEGTRAYESALGLKDDLPTRLKLGIAYLRLKRSSEAVAEAERVIVADPDNAEAWKLKGNALAESDSFVEAAHALAHSLKLHGDTATAYTLAICFLQMKELAKSRVVFDDLEKHTESKAAVHMVEGHAYREAGLTDLAIAQYKKALAIDPKAANAHYFLGLTTLMLHEWDTGDPFIQREFRAELVVNPDNFLANYMLGWVAWRNHDYETAQSVLKRAAQISPKLPEPYLYLGLIAFDGEHYEDAELLLRKAIDLTAGDDARNFYQIRRAYIDMGRIFTIQHNAAEASTMFNKARLLQELSLKQTQQHVSRILATGGPAPMGAVVPLETKTVGSEGRARMGDDDQLAAKLSPGQQKEAEDEQSFLRSILASAYNDFATAEAKSGEFPSALVHFREAERWDPDFPNLQRNIGLAAMKTQDYAGATPALQKELSAHPDDKPVRAMLGLAWFAQERYRESAEALNGLGDAVFQDPKLAYTFAAALAHTGNSAEARAVLDRVTTDQLPPDTILLVAQAYADALDFDRAISLFHRASELQPNLARAHYDAGMAYLRSDRPALAQKEFENELALVPDDTDAKYNLAFSLLQQSQYERAKQLLEQVTAADPRHADAQYELGKLLLQDGDTADAVHHLEMAAKNAPGKDYIHYQLQQAYRKASRPEDAERELAIYKQLKERAKTESAEGIQR
ncbi:MAG: tetratricopeptide repeat protein [Acidobacteria bacterium]|nr:tetratricopeptide repeat protein [Acidobacteriota bacterium]